MPKQANSIFAEERKKLIVDFINMNIKATVDELCSQFSVSPATVRNDLRDLEEAKLIKRTHGGAISVKNGNFELNSYEKSVECISQKEAISRAAVEYVAEGDIIAVDSGTTTFEFAKQLVHFRNLTVVTNDIQIAAFLEKNSAAEIIVAGGKVRREFNCTTGQKAIETLKDLNADKAFIGGNGISLQKGLTTPNMDMAGVKRMLMDISAERIFLGDSTKVERCAFVKFGDITDLDRIIMDQGADAEFYEKLKELGIKVDLV